MKQIFPILLLALGLAPSLIAQGNARWVMAPSGLNLRENASPSSKKIATVPFLEEVQLVATASGPSITVDHIKAGMAEVKFQSYKGFMFEGYLSKFPPPPSNSKTEAYVYSLRDRGFDVPYEEHNYDYDGYYQYHEVFFLSKASWEESFFIARTLYQIPEKLSFPKPSNRKEESFSNPDKNENAWTDGLEVTRNSSGELEEITYSYRGEGGGHFVTLVPAEKDPAMKITYGLIGD